MQVLHSFRQIYAAVRLNYETVDPETGIGTAQLWALGVIRAHAGIGMNALAKTMDWCKPSASNLAKALQDKGLDHLNAVILINAMSSCIAPSKGKTY